MENYQVRSKMKPDLPSSVASAELRNRHGSPVYLAHAVRGASPGPPHVLIHPALMTSCRGGTVTSSACSCWPRTVNKNTVSKAMILQLHVPPPPLGQRKELS